MKRLLDENGLIRLLQDFKIYVDNIKQQRLQYEISLKNEDDIIYETPEDK